MNFLKQILKEFLSLHFAWKNYIKDAFSSGKLRNFFISLTIGVSATVLVWVSQLFIKNISVYAQGENVMSVSPTTAGVFSAWLVGGSVFSVMVGAVRRNYGFFKRAFDFIFASGCLVMLFPLFLIIWFLVKVDSDGPAFFRQVRLGKNGKTFEMLKFRTMRDNAEFETGPVWTQDDDPRETRIGEFLRKSHLDELPQLVNMIRGDMSLIGPRPERPEFRKTICLKIPGFDERLRIRPGLTGLAQTRYHYGASLKDAARKLRYDMLYIKKKCWMLDFQIVLWTFGRVLTGEGAR